LYTNNFIIGILIACKGGDPFNPVELYEWIMSKENLSEVITFRLSEAEYKPYRALLKKSKMKRSKFFREVFISKSENITLKQQEVADNSRLLFLASKTSNNINQIAKKLNKAYRGGIVSETTYKEVLNNLISVERSFAKSLSKC
jgi:hypothetical protein